MPTVLVGGLGRRERCADGGGRGGQGGVGAGAEPQRQADRRVRTGERYLADLGDIAGPGAGVGGINVSMGRQVGPAI